MTPAAGPAGRRRSAGSWFRAPGRSTGCRPATRPAVVLEADFGPFVRRATRGFQEAGHADAAQHALAFGRGPASGEAGVIGGGEDVVDVGGETAAIDRRAQCLGVGELRDQVAAAQFDRIEAALAGGVVDQALDQIVRFRLAGAAIGIDRHGVGERRAHIHEDRRDDVAAAHRRGRGVGGTARSAARHVGAEIGDGADVQREEVALGIQRQPGAADIVAALRGGDEILGAALDPFHRPAQFARGPEQHDPFGIQRVLDAEAAADIGRHDMDPLARNMEDAVGQLVTDGVHAGGGDEQMQQIAVRMRDRGAGFHRRDDQAVVDEFQFDAMRGMGERLLDGPRIALLETERQVSRRDVPQLRRGVVQRARAIDDGRQRVVLDRQRLGRLHRLVAGLGDDERDRVADMPDPADRQRRARRDDHRRQCRHLRCTGQRPEVADVVRGEHAQHAADRAGRVGIDMPDQRMRVRRSNDMRPCLAWQVDVFDEASLAGQEAMVLEARRGLADEHHADWSPCLELSSFAGLRTGRVPQPGPRAPAPAAGRAFALGRVPVRIRGVRRCRSPAPGRAACSRWRPRSARRSCGGPAPSGTRSRPDRTPR